MNKEKRLENADRLINLIESYSKGKDIQKCVNGNLITITESSEIERISISNVEIFRVKSNFRPCKDKSEFIGLFTKDIENLGLMEKSTGVICVVYKIYNDFIKVVRKGYHVDLPYSTLFENYVFYNREKPIIGIKVK